jgi:hypothetical protein
MSYNVNSLKNLLVIGYWGKSEWLYSPISRHPWAFTVMSIDKFYVNNVCVKYNCNQLFNPRMNRIFIQKFSKRNEYIGHVGSDCPAEIGHRTPRHIGHRTPRHIRREQSKMLIAHSAIICQFIRASTTTDELDSAISYCAYVGICTSLVCQKLDVVNCNFKMEPSVIVLVTVSRSLFKICR